MAGTRQINPHSRWLPARYVLHIASFVLQDALLLVLMESQASTIVTGWGLGGAKTLTAAIAIGAVITSISLFIVWLCQDEESYETNPSSFAWLYARGVLAALVIVVGLVGRYGELRPTGIAVLTIALIALLITTLIDAAILSIRGIAAG